MPIQMFARLPPRPTFVPDTNFVSGTEKVFLILSAQKHFVSATNVPSLRSPRNITGNNESATMCPRSPGPLWQTKEIKSIIHLEMKTEHAGNLQDLDKLFCGNLIQL